jgi:hypothetical protein
MTREFKAALKIVNQQAAIVEALISSLVERGLADRQELAERVSILLTDRARSERLYQSFLDFLAETPDR